MFAGLLCGEEPAGRGLQAARGVARAVSFTRKIPIRKGGRFVAIGTRNICSGQLGNRWGEIFLKGPSAHEIGAREIGFSKEDLRADWTLRPERTVRLQGSEGPMFA